MNEPKPLPSETKLVETRRTDAEHATSPENGPVSPQCYGRMTNLARQLERELASLADELLLAQTELKGCYRLIDELKEDLRLAREEQIALLRFVQKEHPVTREMWKALFPSST